MDYIFQGFRQALGILFSLNPEFLLTVWVSIRVAFTSTILATVVGCPLGVLLARTRFPGREGVLTVINTLMSMPTVVIGLMLYSFFSRRGPLGSLGLLYTLAAMVIGQFVLALPILTGLTTSAVQGLDDRVNRTALALGASSCQAFRMLLKEARYALLAAIIAGFGRVFSEVGVSMMLGGNIRGYTRNITTSIALETSKGEFAMGIALGILLLTVALGVNILLARVQRRARRGRL